MKPVQPQYTQRSSIYCLCAALTCILGTVITVAACLFKCLANLFCSTPSRELRNRANPLESNIAMDPFQTSFENIHEDIQDPPSENFTPHPPFHHQAKKTQQYFDQHHSTSAKTPFEPQQHPFQPPNNPNPPTHTLNTGIPAAEQVSCATAAQFFENLEQDFQALDAHAIRWLDTQKELKNLCPNWPHQLRGTAVLFEVAKNSFTTYMEVVKNGVAISSNFPLEANITQDKFQRDKKVLGDCFTHFRQAIMIIIDKCSEISINHPRDIASALYEDHLNDTCELLKSVRQIALKCANQELVALIDEDLEKVKKLYA